MAEPERITVRQRAILSAILESYVASGEPVGSATLSRLGTDAMAMSPATIRNEMAALTSAGLLEQPHTSAGRIPTARGFRMYVEDLNGARGSAESLPERQRQEIDLRFAGLSGTHALLERTSHVLATMSSGVGVAVAVASDGDLLEHVHFSRLAPKRILAVVVTRSGMVRDRVLALDCDPPTRELEGATQFLNENYRGWNLEHVRAELARRVEQERTEYQRMLASIEQLWSKAMPAAAETQQTVYVGGVANLVAGMGSGEDRQKLRELLAALEAKQRLVELLNAYVDARQQSVRVIFDLEEQAPEMAGLVLIAAPARVAGEQRGTVGVLGTKRMDYEQTMGAVSYIAQAFDRMLYPSG